MFGKGGRERGWVGWLLKMDMCLACPGGSSIWDSLEVI